MSKQNMLAGLFCLASVCTTTSQALAESVYVVTTGNQLARFESFSPGTIQSQVQVSGLVGGETIVGLDYRITDQQLYAVTDEDRVYTINYISGAATAVGTGYLPPATGTSVGFDFNPRVDLLRLVTENEENYRINPNTGATVAVDTSLSYAIGDVNLAINPTVTAAAYTRNSLSETSTTLYALDTVLDVLVRVGGLDGPPSPNGGTLTTVGPLGVDASNLATLDVSPLDTSALTAFATLNPTGAQRSTLYMINLLSGTALPVGEINLLDRVAAMTLVPDSDADGIPDGQDQCPDTFPGSTVGNEGCATTSVLAPNLAGLWVNINEKCKTNNKGTKCNIKGQFAVANNGRMDAGPTTVNFYVSDDSVFDASDTPFYSTNVTLKAGKLKKVKVKFKSDQPLLSGQAVIAVIDGNNLVQESDESDNTEVYGPQP